MSVRLLFGVVFISVCCMLVVPATAQGFGGLGSEAEGFEVPSRQTRLEFPQDHGSHSGFRIEWWYLTANLRGEDGRDYGVQWTLFRNAVKPANAAGPNSESDWSTSQLWMGHAAVTTPDAHFVSETRSRGVFGLAGTQAEPFKAWINDWQMSATEPDQRSIDQLNVSANGERFSFQLNLQAKGPLILHGDRGYSVKSPTGQASHYYSQPHYHVSGQVMLPEGPVQVTGTAWLDREWSSQLVAKYQSGWDWVSLHLDDGSKLMGFRLRGGGGERGKERDFYTSATWISPNGVTIAYPDGKLRMSELVTSEIAGRSIPTGWRVQLEEQNIDLEIIALNRDSWMSTSFPYWEGPVKILGSHGGKGYLEMTGY